MGDGFITSRCNSVEEWNDYWARVRLSAKRHGRNPAELYTMILSAASLIRPGEPYDPSRIKVEVGPWATVTLHSLYERVTSIDQAPEALRPIFGQYKAYMDDRIRGDDQYYLTLHDGHGMYLRPDEERFVTGELVRQTTMTAPTGGTTRAREEPRTGGVKQIAFIPTPSGYETFVREFSGAGHRALIVTRHY